jgi:hypothetical protein
MNNKAPHMIHIYGIKPIPERKTYRTDPPETHRYGDITYHFERKIKDNMYSYISETGFRTCFDNFELRIKEE